MTEAVNPSAYIHYTPEQEKILSNLKAKMGDHLKTDAPAHLPARKTILQYDDGEEEISEGSFDAWHITSQIMRHDRNKFKGWLCNMGVNNIFIDEKGYVNRGLCTGGESLRSVGHIDNLTKIKWPTTATICPHTYCYCEGEVGITKRKLKSEEIKLLKDKIKERYSNVRA